VGPRRTAVAVLATLAVLTALTGGLPPGAVAGAQETESVIEEEVSDTISVVKADESPSTADVAVRLSAVTLAAGEGATVLIGRDDEFADAMASAVLQDAAPLLLVPRTLPLPPPVVAEIQRLGATDAVVLGGETAVPVEVADALADLGLDVSRRQGPSRFETATAIAAEDAPAADTAILARAFAAEGSTDPTQAFADSIAAGGLSAETGWPILLTQTDALTGATREHLAASSIETVLLVGGTAAISEAVATELQAMGMVVERVAGESRAGTAVAVAAKAGVSSAADVPRTVLVDGTEPDAWAAGFAAAGHAAAFDAPIVLSAGDELPPETAAWFGAGDQEGTVGSTTPVLACASRPVACERARQRLRLPPRLRLTVGPAVGSEVVPGQAIGLRVDGLDGQEVGVRVADGCAVGILGRLDDVGRARTTIREDAPAGPCDVRWQLARPGGTVHSGTVTYLVAPPP
jgi:putative cell wall-binding protein